MPPNLRKKPHCRIKNLEIKKLKEIKLEDVLEKYSASELQLIALGAWCVLFIIVFFIFWAMFHLTN